MDKQIYYSRLMLRLAQQKDRRVLKFIDKPDPIIEGLYAMLKRDVLHFVGVK